MVGPVNDRNDYDFRLLLLYGDETTAWYVINLRNWYIENLHHTFVRTLKYIYIS